MSEAVYPGCQWDWVEPEEAGFDTAKLSAVKDWLDTNSAGADYRAVIVRGGRVVAEWCRGLERDDHQGLASAAKSIFSCMLGIAIAEGRIESADARLVDYYPEALEVPEGRGPKEGRYAFPKDRDINLRQLISNTSGYMKPGEAPGKVFHYQTYGMNVLTHAIAKSYGLYSVDDPEGSPGLSRLIDEKLRLPMQASWGYYLGNFKLPASAKLSVFGYYDGVSASALDMARLGLLWLHHGRWRDEQLVPEGWLRAATRTAPNVLENCPPEQWSYGYGFWTNDYGRLWPSLPRDSFAASGAGRQHIWVCPSLDLVVVQSPGVFEQQEDNERGVVRLVLDAVR